MPGSHKEFVACIGQTPENHFKDSLRKQEYGVPDHDSLTRMVQKSGIDTPVGKAGSIVILTAILCTVRTAILRRCRDIFMVYNSVENKVKRRIRARSQGQSTSPPAILYDLAVTYRLHHRHQRGLCLNLFARLILMIKGRRGIASLLAMLEVFVYLLGLNLVLQNLDNPFNMAAYCLGFGLGVYAGSRIEEYLALGYIVVQVIVNSVETNLAMNLREKGMA